MRTVPSNLPAAGAVRPRRTLSLPIPDSHRDLLTRPIHGVFTTMMPDGQPQSSLVWCDIDRSNLAPARPKEIMTMRTEHSTLRWGHILLAGVAAATLSMLLVLLIVTVYDMGLAVQAHRQPEHMLLPQLAGPLSPWVRPALAALLTFGAAFWVTHTVGRELRLQGGLVGLVTALSLLVTTLIFGGTLNLIGVVGFVLTVAGGWLGGVLGCRGTVSGSDGQQRGS